MVAALGAAPSAAYAAVFMSDTLDWLNKAAKFGLCLGGVTSGFSNGFTPSVQRDRTLA